MSWIDFSLDNIGQLVARYADGREMTMDASSLTALFSSLVEADENLFIEKIAFRKNKKLLLRRQFAPPASFNFLYIGALGKDFSVYVDEIGFEGKLAISEVAVVSLLLISLLITAAIGLAITVTRRLSLRRIEASLRDARLKIAEQVAHDIRSPLTALEMVMKEAGTLPEDQRILVRSATSRIRDIANELLNKNRAVDSTIPAEPAFPQLLSAIIELIVTEKRMQYRGHAGIEIEAQLGKGSFGLFATLPPNEFKRVISNLVNNSVEAIENGHVIIAIRRENDDVLVEVQDNGKGIPPEVLAKLGEQSISHGKEGSESGSGLGVLHARKSVESWGGRLEVSSEIGKGSTFTLRLPRSDPPQWFLPEILLDAETIPVVIDDDMSILRVWEGRFASVGIKNFVHFSSAENFNRWHANTEKNSNYRFFFDYELLGSIETGIDLIEKHDLSSKSILVTSRFEERKILDRVQRLKIKLLPKGLVAYVPIRQSDPKSILCLDAILIDDEALIHQAWGLAAKKKNKSLLCFYSVAEFFERLPSVAKDTCIYIDSDLAPEQLKGEEIAKDLFERGYRNLFLCTGYPASRFPRMPWIKEILGKEPPWL